jgi:hypothetical protein
MSGDQPSTPPTTPLPPVLATVAWLWILVPFVYGVWQLLIKVVPLFGH